MAEAELLARCRREEPRSAVETLCRSLAGKNRQLARQIDEYGKLVRRVKQLERGDAGPAGGGAPVAGSTGAGSIADGPRRAAVAGDGWNVLDGGIGACPSSRAQPAAGSGVDRSCDAAWGADDEDAWDDVVEGGRRA